MAEGRTWRGEADRLRRLEDEMVGGERLDQARLAMVHHADRPAQLLEMQCHEMGNVSIILNHQDSARHTIRLLSHRMWIRARIL